ncbi:MAG: NAD-binding protein [Desulfoprunum sp.]|nr:NAD-binding protein [Desulfoprunum sp.]
MESRNRIRLAILLLIFFLGVGTVGYVIIEGYPLLDAVYMTVITIATVGFGEIHPLSQAGRLFTIFLILSGVGSLGFAIQALTEMMLERASNPKFKKKAMEKKVAKLKGHYIICGYGRVGAAAAEHFEKAGAPFVVIEAAEDLLKELHELGFNYIDGDATREEILGKAGIKKASALLALLDSDPHNLFTVLTAREMNPTLHIIARTQQASSESRILRAGADSIISPYSSAGRRVADRILARTAATQGRKGGDAAAGGMQHRWFEVTEKSELAGHAVEAANSIVGGGIIGIRRGGKDILIPPPEAEIHLGDALLVSPFQSVNDEDSQANLQPMKIVLIDDNPVIRRLYTRLFQKAGFNIITASTGREGYELILKERPDAAVIDFKLPDISGLEVCRQIRASELGGTIKLFLFTADEEEETRKQAMDVGVDEVVVKSPEAGEIVATVKNGLS